MPAVADPPSSKLLELGRRLVEMPRDRLEAFLNRCEPHQLEKAQRAISLPEVVRYGISRRYVDDPVGWVTSVLHEHLWSKQEDIYRSVLANRYTAVPAAHGVGKSYCSARLALWWIESHPPGTAFVVSTAPTSDQVRGVLWREMNRGHAKGGLSGRMGVAQWMVAGELVAVGRKPANTNPAAFQGLHQEFMLVVIDEADGVAEAIFDAAADTLATNDDARVVAIGNPDRGAGAFFKACMETSEWNVVRISALDSPNFTGEEVPPAVSRVLVSRAWVAERATKWGEDDPRYQSKVLGFAPSDNPLGVIPYSKMIEATRGDPDSLPADRYWLDDRGTRHRLLADTDPPDGATVRYEYRWAEIEPGDVHWGVDVGAGGDLTVCWERRGHHLARRTSIRSNDSEVTADHIEAWALQVGCPASIKIDSIGVGWGIAGALRRKAVNRAGPLHGAAVHSINVSMAGKQPGYMTPGFVSLRSEIWWDTRERLIAGTMDLRVLAGDDWDEVLSEFLDPTWQPSSNGRIQVSSKDETRARLDHSPDDADAINLAFHDPRLTGSTAAASRALVAVFDQRAGTPGQGLLPNFSKRMIPGQRFGT